MATSLRVLAACGLSAALFFLALPPNDLAFLSVLVLVPWMLLMPSFEGTKLEGLRCFLVSWLIGACCQAAVCWWMLPAVVNSTGLSFGASSLLFLGLVCLQGLQFGVAGLVFSAVRRLRVPYGLSAPIAVVLAELATPQVFPYTLAATLHAVPILNQIAEVTGHLGLVALVALGNAAIASGIRAVRNGDRDGLGLTLSVMFAVAGSCFVYGAVRLHGVENDIAEAPSFDVLVVNPKVSAEDKRREPRLLLERYQRTTERILESYEPALVVWGETAIARPMTVRMIEDWFSRSGLGRANTSVILGAVVKTDKDDDAELLNAAVTFDAQGDVCGDCVYAKRALIPIAETALAGFMPTERRAFKEGVDSAPILSGGKRPIALLICYEVLSTDLVGSVVSADVGLIVNIASDLWFESPAAASLQLAIAQLRAVEHRRFLVRSAVGGPNAIIDSRGVRLVETTETVVRTQVRWLQGRTLYGFWGDWPVLLGSLGTVVVCRFRRARPQFYRV